MTLVRGAWNHGVCGVNPRQPLHLVHIKTGKERRVHKKEREATKIVWKDLISSPSRQLVLAF